MKKVRNEAQLWQVMKSDIIGPKDHVSRIESHATSPGVFDVNWKPKMSSEVWVELKCYTSDRKIHPLLPSQYRWAMDRVKAGGNCFILASLFWRDKQYYLVVRPKWFLEFKTLTESSNRLTETLVFSLMNISGVYNEPSEIRFHP